MIESSGFVLTFFFFYFPSFDNFKVSDLEKIAPQLLLDL